MTAIEELESAGLSNYSARAYYTLLAFGKQTARAVSNNSKIPQTRAFDVLRQLEELGLAEKIQQKPMAWVPVKPDVGIASIIERKIAGYSELEKRLVKSLETLKVGPAERIYEKVTVVSGFKEVFSVISAYMRQSLKTAWISSVGEQITTEAEIETARAARRGVNVRFIASVYGEENKQILEKWREEGWTIRHLPGSREFTFAIFDKRVCAIMVKDPRQKNERMLIAIENSDMAAAFSEYYEILWKRGRPIA